jgi:hypothetical protein
MSFYSQEIMEKYADIFGDDWNEFLDTKGEKSELSFFNFLINMKNNSLSQNSNSIYINNLEDVNFPNSLYLFDYQQVISHPGKFSIS